MHKHFYSTKITLSGFMAFALLTLGCGAQKTTFNSASRGGLSTTPTTSTSLGECNQFNFSNFNFIGQVGTYYDPSTHQSRVDLLNLNVVAAPTEIFTSDTSLIQFFRWSEKTIRQKVVNQIPVRIVFMDKLTGYSTAPTTYDRISKSVLTQVKNTFGSAWSNVTLAQFFDRTLVVLTGMDLTYDAVSMAYYDTARSTLVLAQGDVLLPAFAANPNTYASYNPFPDLYTLHPNYSRRDSGGSDSDFMLVIEQICQSLAGAGTRIPASIEATHESESLLTSIWNTLRVSFKTLMDLFF